MYCQRCQRNVSYYYCCSCRERVEKYYEERHVICYDTDEDHDEDGCGSHCPKYVKANTEASIHRILMNEREFHSKCQYCNYTKRWVKDSVSQRWKEVFAEISEKLEQLDLSQFRGEQYNAIVHNQSATIDAVMEEEKLEDIESVALKHLYYTYCKDDAKAYALVRELPKERQHFYINESNFIVSLLK